MMICIAICAIQIACEAAAVVGMLSIIGTARGNCKWYATHFAMTHISICMPGSVCHCC